MGFSSAGRVADAAGISADDAEDGLIALAQAGLVTHERGAFGGWGVTDAGKLVDAERVAGELDAEGARGVLTEAYRRFVGLNSEFLDLCSAWQMRAGGGGPVINDHEDAGYDGVVLERLGDFDGRAVVVLGEISGAVARFGRYRERLGVALGRVRGGEIGYVADELESYHHVWFQLHEDLLVTLGIPR
ncbi:transcriptional regulator [Actinoplanes sp. NBRC 103695]|uniref:transcriptional regulator n=1 Tax=Actinoplanes sp. NBRC 103695 TaxID=3032202 RepID=UPI0025555336|nr:transcriptional regulator [Actinoplanes sp. NBRC 103695]